MNMSAVYDINKIIFPLAAYTFLLKFLLFFKF